jgi:hypothetical protein
MAKDRRAGFSSPFDEMLERNRKEFEKLAGGARPRRPREPRLEREPQPPPAPTPRAGAAAPRPAAAAPRPAPIAPPPPAIALSPEIERRLDERLGKGWSYEVTERRREGDEIIVRCKLTIPERNLSKTQFGRARVAPAGAEGALKGSADGLAFSIETNGAPLSGVGASEDEAFRQAIESALAKCAELLSKTLGTGGVKT